MWYNKKQDNKNRLTAFVPVINFDDLQYEESIGAMRGDGGDSCNDAVLLQYFWFT